MLLITGSLFLMLKLMLSEALMAFSNWPAPDCPGPAAGSRPETRSDESRELDIRMLCLSTDLHNSSRLSILKVGRLLWQIVGPDSCLMLLEISLMSWSCVWNSVWQQAWRHNPHHGILLIIKIWLMFVNANGWLSFIMWHYYQPKMAANHDDKLLINATKPMVVAWW